MEIMPQPSTPVLSATPNQGSGPKPINWQDIVVKPVASLLSSHVDSLKDSIPDTFSSQVSQLPDPNDLFAEYGKTGNPLFKEAAGSALNHLQNVAAVAKQSKLPIAQDANANPSPRSVFPVASSSGVSPLSIFDTQDTYTRPAQKENIDNQVPDFIPAKYKAQFYSVAKQYPQTSLDILTQHYKKEGSNGDPAAINHNADGTIDYGLMQINSSMIPWLTKEFAAQGKKFDWKDPNDSIEASAMMDKENARVIRNNGLNPTPKDIFAAYNTGPQSIMGAATGNPTSTAKIKKYVMGTIFQ